MLARYQMHCVSIFFLCAVTPPEQNKRGAATKDKRRPVYRQPTAPARHTSSKAARTPHYCWYSVRVARPLFAIVPLMHGAEKDAHRAREIGNENLMFRK